MRTLADIVVGRSVERLEPVRISATVGRARTRRRDDRAIHNTYYYHFVESSWKRFLGNFIVLTNIAPRNMIYIQITK